MDNKVGIQQRISRTGHLHNYLSTEEVGALINFSAPRVIFDGVCIWLVILACLALASFYHDPLIWGICFVVIASRQLALTHMVHDACHFRLSPDKTLNDLVGDIFFAAPVLISTQTYRTQHLPHHRSLGDSRLDTDRRAWYSIKGWHFLRRSLLILMGGEALATFLAYSAPGAKADDNQPGDSTAPSLRAQSLRVQLRRLLLAALTNGLLLAYCWWLGNIVIFFALWLLPMFTLTMYLLTLRVIAEHQSLEYASLGRDDFQLDLADPLIRTVQPGPIGKFLLGSFNFFYHHEHHLAPAVRYANLPKLHRLLVVRGYYRDHPQALGPGYLATLYRLVFPTAENKNDVAVRGQR